MASLVSSICWVNRGVAKSRPDKLSLQASDLENIIDELKGGGDDNLTLGGDGEHGDWSWVSISSWLVFSCVVLSCFCNHLIF